MAVNRSGFPIALKALYDFIERLLPGGVKLQTTGAAPVAVDFTRFESKITSGGTAGVEALNLGAPTAATFIPGTRKLLTLTTRTNAGDVVTIDKANMVKSDGTTQPTTATLPAAGDWILVQAAGTKWQVVAFSSTSIT